MKKLIYFLLIMLIFVSAIGCNKNESISDTEITTVDLESMEDAARIVVNGKDITNGQYYRYKYSGNQSEIPLLAVFDALGARVKWVNQTKVKVACNGERTYFDTTKTGFDIIAPPGTYNGVREVRGKELVVDIYSVKGLISSMTGATVRFDDETQTIYFEKAE